jgi:hypothetical protein
MRMISDHSKWLIVICFPLMVSAADKPCNLLGLQRSGPGWLSTKVKADGTLVYLVLPKNFETVSNSAPWAINARARYAALTGFSEYFRKVVVPEVNNSVLMVKRMQIKSLKCSDGIFISYELKLSDMSWGPPESQPSLIIDRPTSPVDSKKPAEPLEDVSSSTKLPARNSGSIIAIED